MGLLTHRDAVAQAQIEFIRPIISLDTLYEGENAPIQFIFKNTGDSDLVVSAVKSSCGCTVPKYTQKRVLPGTYDTILATYNSVGHLGTIDKYVRVESNAKNGTQNLLLKGLVLAYAPNIRMYYSSSNPDVRFSLDRNKNISYKIAKPSNERPQDISLVIYQESNSNGSLILNKEELASKGISIKILKQSNKNVSIDYITDSNLILNKEFTYIIQFTLKERTNQSITAQLNGKNLLIQFQFVE